MRFLKEFPDTGILLRYYLVIFLSTNKQSRSFF